MTGAETEVETGQPIETADGPAEAVTGHVEQLYGDQTVQPDERKPIVSPRFLLAGLGAAAVAGLILFGVARTRSTAVPVAFQDLGAGISNATGIRGSLKARWQGSAAQYQLEIEPIDPLQSAGFSFVVANPPGPLFIHMKLLDATGFAVCGKDVLFPFDAASPGEQDRERGQDLLQSSVGPDGKVLSLSAQGTLPCTAAQYKQVVYWDISTNFPALAEQDELMKHTHELKARQEAQKHAALMRSRTPRSSFYMEGDDRIIGYDAAHNLLESRLNRNFLVAGVGQQSMASLWAVSGALFHYKCDQHSRCMLTRAGGGQRLNVTVLQ